MGGAQGIAGGLKEAGRRSRGPGSGRKSAGITGGRRGLAIARVHRGGDEADSGPGCSVREKAGHGRLLMCVPGRELRGSVALG